MDNVRALLKEDHYNVQKETINNHTALGLKDVIDDLFNSGKKFILTIGKVGVGKTTIAAAIAVGLAERGKKVHLTTTDSVPQLEYGINEVSGITMSHIEIAYVEEDARAPSTQEIAVIRAFAQIVDKAKEQAEDQVLVIDTAPTGNTLLRLESTQSNNLEMKRSKGDVSKDISKSAKKILTRLRNADETEVIIVTLAEATSVYEGMRLEDDLRRADINSKWWVINSSLHKSGITNDILSTEASNETQWINKVDTQASGNYAIIGWSVGEIKG
ncbi:ArsA-related P-loop ATPase [[Clostridium] fimetarium]|uniref:Arsenite-transporting ATPase n=1 Tax=[Clostridium] fimetarium TaxID=99656 RepID=A0A1I0Q9S5_9FIRM|nr:ArsA-related P-loop ATPase [[Clostridium] fimetarium]SEW23566.1 arsenite-transporting ATPase [[Clostridium] fimetarium]